MFKIRSYEFSEHNPLYGRKELSFRRFNFWWARLNRIELYQRHISRSHKRHRFLFNRFKGISSFNKWLKPAYTFFSAGKLVKERINFFPIRKELGFLVVPVTPSIKKIMELGFHIGGIKTSYTSKIRRYLMWSRSKKNIQVFDVSSTLNSYKSSFLFSSELRKQKGVFHFIATRSDDEYRKTFRPYNRIYAKRSASFNTSKKWLGGTLTNLLQLTLQKNIEDHINIDPFEFFQAIFYTRKRKKRTDYKIPDMTVLFDGSAESYGCRDSITLKIPSLVSTSNSVNPDLACYPIYVSHNTNTILHMHNRIFLKALKKSKFRPTYSAKVFKKFFARCRKIKKIKFKTKHKEEFLFFKSVKRRLFHKRRVIKRRARKRVSLNNKFVFKRERARKLRIIIKRSVARRK